MTTPKLKKRDNAMINDDNYWIKISNYIGGCKLFKINGKDIEAIKSSIKKTEKSIGYKLRWQIWPSKNVDLEPD
jgi:hypothetical protein